MACGRTRESEAHAVTPVWTRLREIVVPPRSAVVILTLASVGAIGTRMLPDASAVAWMIRVASVSTLVGVIPGALVLLAWRPRESIGLLELLGLSLAISFAVVQVCTVAALTLHCSPMQTTSALAVFGVAHAAMALQRTRRGVTVRITPDEIAVALVVAGLAIFLYAAGSPFEDQEDVIHVSVVQRLAYLPTPAIGNIYLSPGITYTYLFPGTHYMLALMSRIGDIEPLFLYHKLRAFWGVAAIVLLYGCARAVFESSRIALASTLVAAAFVANGTFADVPGLQWAQMAPYSHASDVALGVLLPALLLLAFWFLRSPAPRESRFFLAATLGMAFMLIAVHPREIVQFLVYLAAFAAVLVVGRGERTLLRRAVVLLVLVGGLLIVYRLAYQELAPAVESLVHDRREDLGRLFMESSVRELLAAPLPLLDKYMPFFPLIFQWWTPVVLLASPVVLYSLRSRPLAWLVAASTVTYLLILRVPVLAIPYAYTTYFEILYTPVRNVIPFVHMLAGVALALVAAQLARCRYVVLSILALSGSWAIIELFRHFGTVASHRPDALFVPVLTGYAFALTGVRRRPLSVGEPHWVDEARPRWSLAFALLLLPVMAVTRVPSGGVVKASWSNREPTPVALVEHMKCRENGEFCTPPFALVEFMRAEVPIDAVLAADTHENYAPTLFMPQQIVIWSGGFQLINSGQLFAGYFGHLARAKAASLDQPFFNDHETRAQRLAFIRDLRVTHVLVTPRLYREMKAALARDVDLFVPRYDNGAWALYEVTVRS